jgi:hypothetical protein
LHKDYNVTGPERMEVEFLNMAVRRDEDTQRPNLSVAIHRSMPEVQIWVSKELRFRKKRMVLQDNSIRL